MTLDEWLKQEKMHDGAFAERIGVSREYVRLLRARRRQPSDEVRAAIRRATRRGVTYAEMDLKES